MKPLFVALSLFFFNVNYAYADIEAGFTAAQAGDFEAVSADLSPLKQESIELVIQDKLN